MTTPPRKLLLLPLLLIAATSCSDKSVTVLSSPPAVTIVEPSGGSSFFEDQEILFRALIESEAAVEDIEHEWLAGSLALCDSAAAEEIDGSIVATCYASFPEAGSYAVGVSVSDPNGRATAVVEITISYNNPPTVTLNTPASGDTFQAGELVVVSAAVDDAEDEPSELSVRVESSLDGDLGASGSPTTGGDYSEGFTLSSGSHLLKVTVTDTSGKTGEDSVTISVNSAPSAPVVSITPDPARSDEGLQANIDTPATDPDGDTLTYTYTWYRDGAEYASGVPSISPNIVTRDEYWEVRVAASDGVDTGPAGVAGLTIANRPPVVESVSLSPASPGELDDVVAVPQNWSDAEGDPERYRYQWTYNGVVDGSETRDTFPADKTSRGDTLQVTVTPYDDYDDGTPVSSSVITVQNSPPTAPVVVISPGSPERDDNLSCDIVTPSTDSDGDTVSYRYNWYQNGVVTAEVSNVVTADLTADGETWECTVTPSDGLDDGPAGSDSVTIVDYTAPDAPILDDLDPYRNDDSAVLSGTCEADCELVFYFSDSTGSWTETDTCGADGSLSHTVYLTRGSTTEAFATCEDAAGNVSGDSNTVSTEACDPYDEYENAAGYGDDYSSAIDEWSTMLDSAAGTITISANALDSSDEDWYVISTTDDPAYENSYYVEDYLFEVALTEGESTYSMTIYRGDPAGATPTCEDGTTEMDWYFEDPTWGRGQGCSPTANTGDYTDCSDFSTDWYILVTRSDSATPSCDPYELTVTNGVW